MDITINLNLDFIKEKILDVYPEVIVNKVGNIGIKIILPNKNGILFGEMELTQLIANHIVKSIEQSSVTPSNMIKKESGTAK